MNKNLLFGVAGVSTYILSLTLADKLRKYLNNSYPTESVVEMYSNNGKFSKNGKIIHITVFSMMSLLSLIGISKIPERIVSAIYSDNNLGVFFESYGLMGSAYLAHIFGYSAFKLATMVENKDNHKMNDYDEYSG